MVDANMAWTADEALERGRRLEQYGLYWYEEPTIPEDVAGHARLEREMETPIAVGESLHSPTSTGATSRRKRWQSCR
jgi:L-alanine-DL-glutamate epimerase-like enolase superfamily enzyme